MQTLNLFFLTLARIQGGETQGDDADSGGGGLFGGNFLIPMALIFVIFWVLMIGPERKQRKRRGEMLANLKKGDKVITTSGLYGVIAQIQDKVVTLQVADGVRLRFAVSSVQDRIDEGAGQPDEKAKEKEKEKAEA